MRRIGTRFCVVVGVFAIGFSAVILYRAWVSAGRHVEEMTAKQAAIALAFDLAIREYVKESIRPEMEQRIGPDEFVLEAMSTSFVARSVVDKVREQFPDYLLRFPSENPRNPINMASVREKELLAHFREDPTVTRWNGRLNIDGVEYYAQASAMRIEENCLRCHGRPDEAPQALLDRYGAVGGFNHRVGDLAGMDMVAIPMDRVQASLAAHFTNELLATSVWLAALFTSIFGAFALIVGRRLKAITGRFEEAASREPVAIEPLPETGNDEIAVLAAGYNTLAGRLRQLHESLEEQVRARTEELSVANERLRHERALLKQSLKMHDRERQVIAYEIHDGLAQQLVGADMAFQLAGQAYAGDSSQGRINYEAGMALLARCVAEVRRLINGVRPPLLDEEGIVAAVRNLLDEESALTTVHIEFHHPARMERMDPVLENAVYRIVQEAVTNARQHSGSDRVCVTLAREDQHLRVEVQDWGDGFDVKPRKGKAMGLRGIKKRAKLLGGRLTIESQPGAGTRIEVTLPLTLPEEDSEDSEF